MDEVGPNASWCQSFPVLKMETAPQLLQTNAGGDGTRVGNVVSLQLSQGMHWEGREVRGEGGCQ